MEAITKVDVINPLITQRWSPRDFGEYPVEIEKIDKIRFIDEWQDY